MSIKYLANTATLILASIAILSVAHAATAPTVALTESGIIKILCSVTNWMFSILIGVSMIMVLVGAFYYVTAGGDSEKVKTGTKTITYAAIGVVVAIVAKGFPFLVAGILGRTITGGCG